LLDKAALSRKWIYRRRRKPDHVRGGALTNARVGSDRAARVFKIRVNHRVSLGLKSPSPSPAHRYSTEQLSKAPDLLGVFTYPGL
jgi:hypothetical protein